MKLKDEEKEKLKKSIQNSDPEKQKREFMDAEQKEEFEKEEKASDKNKK